MIVETYESNFGGRGPFKKLPWWAWIRRRRQERELKARLDKIWEAGKIDPEDLPGRDEAP